MSSTAGYLLSSNPSDQFADAARKVAEAGKNSGIPLRILGACAIRIHSHGSKQILDQIGRAITDLDFVCSSKHEHKVPQLLISLGYRPDSEASKFYAHMYGNLRDRFKDANNGTTLDVFYDRLEMCHTIELGKRLDVDFPTISVSDLILEKMQIVKMNEKDVKDALVLFREHPITDSDGDTVNAKYLAEVLSKDWGFYYTVTTNLNKLIEFASSYKVLEDSSQAIKEKISKLIQVIEAEAKTMKWKMRAKVGPRQKWYNDVDEVSMGAGDQDRQ